MLSCRFFSVAGQTDSWKIDIGGQSLDIPHCCLRETSWNMFPACHQGIPCDRSNQSIKLVETLPSRVG